MSQNYSKFQDDLADPGRGYQEMKEGSLSTTQGCLPSFKEYPACIMKEKFPNLNYEKDEGKNYFSFKTETIPESCKELEQKIFADPLKYALAKESQDTLKNEFYTKLKKFFGEKFLESQSEVIFTEADEAENIDSLNVGGSYILSFTLNSDDSKLIYHKDESLILYDLQNKKEVPNFFKEPHASVITSIQLQKKTQKGGDSLVTCSNEEIFVWNISTGERTHSILAKNKKELTEFNQVVLSPDGAKVYAGCRDGKIHIYDLADLKKDNDPLEGHEENIACLTITSKGELLISGSDDNTVRVWDLRKKKELHLLKKHLDNITGLALTTDDTTLYTSGLDNQLIGWNLKTGKEISNIDFQDQEIVSMALFPDNSTVILSSYSVLTFWDLISGKMIFSLETDGEEFSCIQITSDCKKILYSECSMQIWNIGNFDAKEHVSEIKGGQNLATMTPNGLNFATIGEKGDLLIWDLKAKKELHNLKGQKDDIKHLLSSNDSSKIFSCDAKDNFKAWDISTGKVLFSLQLSGTVSGDNEDEEKSETETYLVITADDKNLVYYANNNNKLMTWSLLDKSPVSSRENVNLTCLAVASDFSVVLGAYDDAAIGIFDPRDLDKEVSFLDIHTEDVSAISITPDNKKAISVSLNEKAVAIWDLQKRILTRLLEADFKSQLISINYLWWTLDVNIVSINGSLLDLNNNNYLMKYRSYPNESRQLISYKENFILNFTKDNKGNIVVEKINQILSYNILLSSFTLRNFFNNDDKAQNEFKEVYEGRALLHPFKFNALHISAMMQGGSQYALPLEDINVPMSALLARDTFGNNCFDILMILKDKENLKKFFELYIRTYATSTFYYKTKLFELDYNPLRENVYTFFSNIMNLFGNTDFVNQFLDLSYVEYDEILGTEEVSMDELSNPLYFIANSVGEFPSSSQIKKMITEELAGIVKTDDNQRKATLSCKVLALEDFVDITEYTNKFYESLSQLEVSDPIFKNKVLEMVVAYKWKNYAKDIYLKDLNYFLLFFSIFLINFLFIFPYRVYEGFVYFDTLEIISFILNVLSLGFFVYYLFGELKQVKRDPNAYFSSRYNYIDIGLIISAFTVLIIDLLNILSVIDNDSLVKLFASIASFLFWMRTISYLRGFEGTAFMIRLIVEVVSDIRYFLLLILMFTLSFNCSIYLIQNSYDNEADSTSVTIYNMFTLCYRLVLGDYTNYDNLSVEYPFYLWLLMIIFTMLLTIILLNLLISIVGKTFDNVWESKSSTRTYELLNIMSSNGGIDEILLSSNSKENLRRNKIIGKYLFCFYNKKSEEENIEQGEFNKKVLENNKDFSGKLEQIVSKINSNASDMDSKIEKLQNEISSNSAKMLRMSKALREILSYVKPPEEKRR